MDTNPTESLLISPQSSDAHLNMAASVSPFRVDPDPTASFTMRESSLKSPMGEKSLLQAYDRDEQDEDDAATQSADRKRFEELGIEFNDNLRKLKSLAEGEDSVVDRALNMIESQNSRNKQGAMETLIDGFSKRTTEEKKIIQKLCELQEERSRLAKELHIQLEKSQKENMKLRKFREAQSQRMSGRFKKFSEANASEDSEMYDWMIDITLLTDVCKEGWKVEFSPKFHDHAGFQTASSRSNTAERGSKVNKPSGWEGAIVSVVGLFDKGKTFVLNNITNSNLPSGKKVNTKGLSFKHVNVDNSTNLVLLDTAGSYSPVRVINELSVLEKEATEIFLLDVVFELSDYFICVVNDFTSLDQRYLNRLSQNLQNSPSKAFREVIVIHNLKEVDSEEVLAHLWETQVTQIYGSGSVQNTKVAAADPETGRLLEKDVTWFKTGYSRHICLCNDDSVLGNRINPWAFSLLKYWLKAVFVPVNRPFSVIDSVINQTTIKLSSYFRCNVVLEVEETDKALVKYIKANTPIQDAYHRIPQISIDSTGFVMSKPDSFLPQVDIIQADKYIIYMDIPGLCEEEITLGRQNSITIVKGHRKKPKTYEGGSLEKSERKYGEFTMTFKIPDIYERKWEGYTVANGVLRIWYAKDKEETGTPY